MAVAVLVLPIPACRSANMAAGALVFAEATVQSDCAPWDGPAATFAMTDSVSAEPSVDHYRIQLSIFRALSDLSGEQMEWSDEERNIGYAARCTPTSDCEVAQHARVTFGNFAVGDSTYTGALELVFADSSVLRGSFRASYVQSHGRCG